MYPVQLKGIDDPVKPYPRSPERYDLSRRLQSGLRAGAFVDDFAQNVDQRARRRRGEAASTLGQANGAAGES